MKCSYCQKEIIRNLTLKEIFLPGPLINEELCSECRSSFTSISQSQRCLGCSKHCEQKYCKDCCYWKEKYPNYTFHHTALFEYDEIFKEWMKQYKIIGDYRLKQTFKKEVANYFKPFIRENFLICPLPLSTQRYVKRGFNQVQAFLEAAEVPTTELLTRCKHSKPQAEKNRSARLKLQQPFELKVEPNTIKDQKVILVDDIYTTGRTIFHAAEVIIECKPKQLCSFSLAR